MKDNEPKIELQPCPRCGQHMSAETYNCTPPDEQSDHGGWATRTHYCADNGTWTSDPFKLPKVEV